jgi:glycosyltransferase involved in cell wall biosynthesis
VTPFFSIIIPTYNRAYCIVRAIQSVLNQQFQDFEIIVVDDGSTDNTRLSIFEIKDKRIQYYYKENGERGEARNFGVLNARGKYVCFLDSDDLIYDNHFSTAYNFIWKKSFPEVFHVDYEYINESGSVHRRKAQLPERLNRFLLKDHKLSCNGVFIKHEIALIHPFIKHRSAVVAEDLYVWLTLACRYPFFHVPVITSAIVGHKERSVKNLSAWTFLKSMILIIKYLSMDEVFITYFTRAKVHYFFAHRMALTALYFADEGNRKWSRKLLWVAGKYSWRILLNTTFLAVIRNLVTRQ